MLILQLLSNPVYALTLLTTLVVGLSVHEWAHARSAYALGDPTALASGRMSLNPAKHIDPLGALFFLIAGFGWARPVPIDPSRLGPRGTILVSAAGPGSNILLAFLALLPVRLGLVGPASNLTGLLGFFAVLNVVLAVFNSLPVPPLDGWRVISGLASPSLAYRLREFEGYSLLLLMAIVVLGSFGGMPILSAIMSPFVRIVMALVAGPQLGSTLLHSFGW